jgi:hypothetical protein
VRRKLAIAGALVLAALLAAVLWLVVTRRALGERLVADVSRLSMPAARPVHRGAPSPGTFEECLGPLLDARGLIGVLFSVGTTKLLAAPCAEAISASDDGARGRFVEELGSIRAGLPSFGKVLET